MIVFLKIQVQKGQQIQKALENQKPKDQLIDC